MTVTTPGSGGLPAAYILTLVDVAGSGGPKISS